MTPSVPSEPTKSWVRSGPDRGPGRAAGVDRCGRRRARRRGRRPCPRSSRSGWSSWPAPRHASQPPTVDRSIDWGQCPSVTPCSARSVVLEQVPNVPARTSSTSDVVVDVDDPGERGEVEHHAAVHGHARAAHAAAPGGRGDRDPRLVARRAAPRRPRRPTAGRDDRRGRRDRGAVERPDHRQRPPVAARLAIGDASVATSAQASRSRASTRRRPRRGRVEAARLSAVVLERDRRRRRAGSAHVTVAERGSRQLGGSRSASHRGARYACDLRGAVLGRRPSRARARSAGRDVGRGGGGRVAGEQPGAGAAREHVVERAGHLVAHRVHRLGPEVGEAGHERLARASGRRRSSASTRRPRCRSDRRGARARSGSSAATGARRCPRRRAGAGAWCAAARRRSPSTRDDRVDRVGGHAPVGGELAAGDGDDPARRDVRTVCRRDRSAVRLAAPLAHERPQPGPRADDVVLGERLVGDAVHARRAGSRRRRACTAGRRAGRRSRCRWCRCR